MTRYDPERDRVRIAGRWLRWGLRWIVVPAALGVFLSGNIDARSLPLVGAERLSAVLLLDGQAYFGHLDDSGESGTLVLRDTYYFQNASGAATNLSVGLVKRGTEAHEPADGMRINRDRVLAVERVGPDSAVAQAIDVEREISGAAVPAISLNRPAIAGADALSAQRVAAEHAIARAYAASVDQLGKLNDLVLPVSKAQAQAITGQAMADLRTVRLSALTGLGRALGMGAADADTYARATDPRLEGQSFANEPGVLLAPDLNALIVRASALYAQVGDAAAKQLTQASATPSPSPSPAASPGHDVTRLRALAGLVLLAAALVACGGAGSGATTDTAQDALNRGLQAHAAGKLDDAVTAYFQTLEKDPKNKFAFYNLGEIAQRQNRMQAAESYYRLALEQDPNMASALFNLAIVRTNAGALQDAIALYRQDISVEPNNAAPHFNLGLLLRQLGQTAEAQQELATAQRLDAKLVVPTPSASPIRQTSPTPRP